MATYYLKSGSGSIGSGSYRGVWTASQTWAVGDRVCTTRSATAARQFKVYECTTLGAGGGTEPTWDSTTGNTTTDNVAVWTCRAATTTANAHMFLDMLCQGEAAGDTIYVSSAHSETSAATYTVTIAGTSASPVKILCVDDATWATTPATTTGAVIEVTGNQNILVTGGLYCYGVEFRTGSTSYGSANFLHTTDDIQVYEKCKLKLAGSGNYGILSLGLIYTSGAQAHKIILRNCDIAVNHASAYIRVASNVEISGGSYLSGFTNPNILFAPSGRGSTVLISGMDLSNTAAAKPLFSLVDGGQGKYVLRNCKLPASWGAGGLVTGTYKVGQRFEMYHSDSTPTNYRLWAEDERGYCISDQSIYATGGPSADAGTTVVSWKVVTTANCGLYAQRFYCPEMTVWNDTTGSSKSISVEIMHFLAADLLDSEVWLEVMANTGSTSSSTVYGASTVTSDSVAEVNSGNWLATAVAQTASAGPTAWDAGSGAISYSAATNYAVGAIIKPSTPNGAVYMMTTESSAASAEPTWGTTDGGTTNDSSSGVWTRCRRQTLSVSVTPTMKGWLSARVIVAKASILLAKPLWISPLPTVA